MHKILPIAVSSSTETAHSWCAKKSQGGRYAYGTVKAVARRNGNHRAIDFNQQLLEPVMRHLSPRWEKVFKHKIPSILDKYTSYAKECYVEFHEGATSEARSRGIASRERLAGLQRQGPNLKDEILGAYTPALEQISEQQREVHRSLTPLIRDAMQSVYQHAAQQAGAGSFVRIRTKVAEHMERSKDKMFKDVAVHLQNAMASICSLARVELEKALGKIFSTITRDYHAALIGDGEEAEAEKMVRAAISELLVGAGDVYRAFTLEEGNAPVSEHSHDIEQGTRALSVQD